jgi:colanic acid biosynthesis protein WcaH
LIQQPDFLRHLEAIQMAVGDARTGLPEDVFLLVSRLTPLINVDLLIQDDDSRTLLTWREDEYFGTGWHVPGGIIRFKERMADRIRACAREELGAEVSSAAAPLFVMEGFTAEGTRGHAISLLFRCRLLTPLDDSRRALSERPAAGEWRWHAGAPSDLLPAQAEYARFL